MVKQDDKGRVTVALRRFPGDIYERVKVQAEREQRKIKQVFIRAVERYLQEVERKEV